VRFIAAAKGTEAKLIQGTGETANISSSGILFRSTIKIPIGSSIRLEVDWPLLDDGRKVCLIAAGQVIRSRQPHVAMRVGHYDFHHSPSPVTEGGTTASGGSRPLVIVADTTPVYHLICSLIRHRLPVLRAGVKETTSILQKHFEEGSNLLVVTNQFPKLAGGLQAGQSSPASGALVLNTNWKPSDDDESSAARTVHIRRTAPADQFRAVVEIAVKDFLAQLGGR
jgi:hypothetical protein